MRLRYRAQALAIDRLDKQISGVNRVEWPEAMPIF
jgi:hypothetical protein